MFYSLFSSAAILFHCALHIANNISNDEYADVKTHAMIGFKALRKFHLFTALCAGLHHNLYKAGYGVGPDTFPSNWSPATVKKVLEISVIISICDFVDAFTTRNTEIKDGSDTASEKPDLKSMLYTKYPDDHVVVDVILDLHEKKYIYIK